MKHATDIVRDAIAGTKAHYPWLWQACLEMRAGASPSKLGSYFPRLDEAALDKAICSLEWEPYTHPDVEAPAQAFIARAFPGRFGMAQLDTLPHDAAVRWDDSKDLGYVELVWDGYAAHSDVVPRVDFVVMLIGPSDPVAPKREGLFVWTFHPGDPVRPSRVKRHDRDGTDRHGTRTTRSIANALGVRWVKLGMAELP